MIVFGAVHPLLGAGDRHVEHVRPINPKLGPLIAEGARRSPAFRALLHRLDRSAVFVYIGYRLMPAGLSGQLTLAGTAGRWRYLRIEIECRRSLNAQVAAIGHELQHAVEIADDDGAVDQPSLQALYRAIGFAIDASWRRFESAAAQETGRQVRRELSSRVPDTAAARADN